MSKFIHWLESRMWDWSINRIKKLNDEEYKREILSLAVQRLFNTIGADDILHANSKGEWMFRNRPLGNEEMQGLRDDAVILKRMRLWHVLKLDVKYQLNKKMFEEARVPLDVVWGQLLLFYEDIIQTRLKKLE